MLVLFATNDPGREDSSHIHTRIRFITYDSIIQDINIPRLSFPSALEMPRRASAEVPKHVVNASKRSTPRRSSSRLVSKSVSENERRWVFKLDGPHKMFSKLRGAMNGGFCVVFMVAFP
jgi:hypothetical protein